MKEAEKDWSDTRLIKLLVSNGTCCKTALLILCAEMQRQQHLSVAPSISHFARTRAERCLSSPLGPSSFTCVCPLCPCRSVNPP